MPAQVFQSWWSTLSPFTALALGYASAAGARGLAIARQDGFHDHVMNNSVTRSERLGCFLSLLLTHNISHIFSRITPLP